MAHFGAEGQINEATLVRMHDRQVPVDLNMLSKANYGRDTKTGEMKYRYMSVIH
jgi:hypothetical protein